MNNKIIIKGIVNWIKKYCNKNKINSLVIGISGGIDSALVSTLCAMTGLKTYIVSMPISQEPNQLARARNHGKWLNDNFKNTIFVEKNLTNSFNEFKKNFNDFNADISFANSKSRLRMICLYQIAGSVNGIVVGTGNKVEDFGVGFYTKYGDGGVDISPIGDLTKTQVRQIAKNLNILEEILQAKPTDGLWEDNRSDEDQIGASYEELEWVMENKNKNIISRQESAEVEVLTGGVSNVVLAITTESKKLVLKQALAELAVSEKWEADQRQKKIYNKIK